LKLPESKIKSGYLKYYTDLVGYADKEAVKLIRIEKNLQNNL